MNKSIKKYKFKMECLSQVREWIQKDAWMCVIDMKDQYLHVLVHESCHKVKVFMAWVFVAMDCTPFWPQVQP